MTNITSIGTGGISPYFIRRPVATSLFMAVILALGFAAYPFLPVAPIPQVDFPTIQVQASLPGASPETMAATVAQPLERQFAQIPGVTQMTSSNLLGSTTIAVQFELDRELDGAAQDIQSAISAAGAQLPRNLPSPPKYSKYNPADSPILGYTFTSEVLPMTELDDYVENIVVQQLSQLPGVGNISIQGQRKPAIRVQIDPIKLGATGLGLEDVRNVITNASTNSPKGYLDVGTKAFTIYGNDQLTTARAFNDVVLTFRNGAPVRISDIGRAIDGAETNRAAGWKADGVSSINISVRKQPGANVVETAKRIEDALPQLEALMPPSVKVEKYQERMETIRASVSEVRTTLFITAVLVVVVIFVFLRNVWATIIPTLAIPLSLIGTFAGMYLLGYSVDNLSLMALTIAVGFVVDDAIVMLENIYRHIEEGMSPMEASLQGSSEIGFTIISMSLSLIAVFIPLLLMGGIIGRLFHEFAVTVSLTILISGVVSLTLTPMMCSRFLRHESGQHGTLYRTIESGFKAISDFYERTLDVALTWRRSVLAVFVATLVLSGILYVLVPKGFFPQQDIGSIQVNTEAAQDISFAEMAKRQDLVRQVIASDPDVYKLGSSIGTGGNTPKAGNSGQMQVMLKDRAHRKATAEEIMNRLKPKLAQLEGIRTFMQANQDINIGARGSKTQYQYT